MPLYKTWLRKLKYVNPLIMDIKHGLKEAHICVEFAHHLVAFSERVGQLKQDLLKQTAII